MPPVLVLDGSDGALLSTWGEADVALAADGTSWGAHGIAVEACSYTCAPGAGDYSRVRVWVQDFDAAKAQAKESGKPDNIIEKMVEGRMRKYLAENTLLGQAFVKDPDTTVSKLLKGRGASLIQYKRFEVGEGIEKKQENFAEEVMAQAKG